MDQKDFDALVEVALDALLEAGMAEPESVDYYVRDGQNVHLLLEVALGAVLPRLAAAGGGQVGGPELVWAGGGQVGGPGVVGPCVCNVGAQECTQHPGRTLTQEQKIEFRMAWDRTVEENR